jgi:hypothetical protein
MSNKLREIMERAEQWPEAARAEALETLREIEEDFVVGPTTQTELERAHQEAREGRGISLQEIKARLKV